MDYGGLILNCKTTQISQFWPITSEIYISGESLKVLVCTARGYVNFLPFCTPSEFRFSRLHGYLLIVYSTSFYDYQCHILL